MISHGNEIKVFTGNSNPVLAEEICAHLNKSLGNATSLFADATSLLFSPPANRLMTV